MLLNILQSFHESNEGKNEQTIFYQDMGAQDNLAAPEDDFNMKQTTLKYFFSMLPVLMSMGFGGTIIGILAWVSSLIW